MQSPELRQMLLGMAGGLVRSVRRSPERRKEDAMNAAKARYERPLEPFRREVSPGCVIEARAERKGPRCWVVRQWTNGVLDHEHVCHSRAKAAEWLKFAELLCEFLWRVETEQEQKEASHGQ